MHRNENKLVIFDWGGVIESHRKGEENYFDIIIKIMKRAGSTLDNENIIKIFKDSIWYNGVLLSTINDEKIIRKRHEKLKEDLKLNTDFDAFMKIYNEEFKKIYFYKDVVKLTQELKEKCKIGILSNLTMLDKERLNNQVILSNFDYVWLSFELGYAKPQEEIYKIVENDCGLDVKNILFIDDRTDNIDVANKHGWNTCQSRGYELDKIKQKVDEFLS